MCLNDFKGKGQSALAQSHVGHVVSLFQCQFIYLPEKEKHIYIQTFNILQKCYLKVKQK